MARGWVVAGRRTDRYKDTSGAVGVVESEMPERLPFDPSRVRPPTASPPGETSGVLSVRAVNELVRGAIERHVPATLHVLGEIGDLSRPGSGHVYFTLKDAASELRCVMWRSSAARLKFAPEAGMQAIATGGIEVYGPRGTYQLIVRKLEPRGVGALEVAFRQLREKLEREGLLDARRKRPLPPYPERVAVVTSPSGAALRDIVHTLARRWPACEVLVVPVRVQGAGAAQEIAAALRQLDGALERLGGVDAIIVGRGGGSLEDLWAFNEEVVARAIVASRVPVISAVGHEVDVSISDLVADVRAATPTAAAELLSPAADELREALAALAARLGRGVQQRAALARAALRTALAYDGLARPLRRVRDQQQLLDEALHRLKGALGEQVRGARARVHRAELGVLRVGGGANVARLAQRVAARAQAAREALVRRLLLAGRQMAERTTRLERRGPERRLMRFDEHLRTARVRLDRAVVRTVRHGEQLLAARLEAVRACDPRAVLRRGYSITRLAKTRQVVRSIGDVQDGTRLITEVADGTFRSTADDPRQPGLFDE
jgi:exodeoxyribonuclease VII large subunit